MKILIVPIAILALTGCQSASIALGVAESKGEQAVVWIVKAGELEVRASLATICITGRKEPLDNFFKKEGLEEELDKICKAYKDNR